MHPCNMCTIAFVFTFYVFMCVNALKGENKKHGENKRKIQCTQRKKNLLKRNRGQEAGGTEALRIRRKTKNGKAACVYRFNRT